jgi:excisionase family DNA binding protein
VGTNRDAEILCVDEVAAWLGLHKNAVYTAAARRRFPCQRFGRRLVFSRDALMEDRVPVRKQYGLTMRAAA